MDLNKLMKQAQQMQAELANTQDQLAQQRFKATGAGGKICAEVDGKGDLLDLQLDGSVLDPDDADFVADLILKTIQEAVATAKAEQDKAMKGITGGMGIPGL